MARVQPRTQAHGSPTEHLDVLELLPARGGEGRGHLTRTAYTGGGHMTGLTFQLNPVNGAERTYLGHGVIIVRERVLSHTEVRA